MASKLPLEKRNAVLGRLWPKLKMQEFGGRNHLLGGGQHRVCLVCGNAAALPSACLRGAAPHPIFLKDWRKRHEKGY